MVFNLIFTKGQKIKCLYSKSDLMAFCRFLLNSLNYASVTPAWPLRRSPTLPGSRALAVTFRCHHRVSEEQSHLYPQIKAEISRRGPATRSPPSPTQRGRGSHAAARRLRSVSSCGSSAGVGCRASHSRSDAKRGPIGHGLIVKGGVGEARRAVALTGRERFFCCLSLASLHNREC